MLSYRGKDLRLIGDGVLEVDFTDGEKRRYDMRRLIPRHPIVQRLIDKPELFNKGKLFHNGMTVYWNDDIDVSVMTVYECGEVI